MKEQEQKQQETPEQRKATKTAFILMFPALIIAGIAIYVTPVNFAVLVLALALYQFLMLRQFIEDYYKKK